MKDARFESSSDVVRRLQSEATGLWPALLGSLSFRRSPCVRENCPACMSGEQHPSYVLYGRLKGRRVAVYVPEELVPEVQRSLDNGRALQELLQQADGFEGERSDGCKFAAGHGGNVREHEEFAAAVAPTAGLCDWSWRPGRRSLA